jgi:hypothetical protein
MKLISYLNLMVTLKMRRAIPLFLPAFFDMVLRCRDDYSYVELKTTEAGLTAEEWCH